MDNIQENPMIMNGSRQYLSLALLFFALPLITGSLSSEQEQNGEIHRVSELACESASEPTPNSQEKSFSTANRPLVLPTLGTIVACMSQAAIRNQTHLRPYTVTREYQLFGQRPDKTRSQVIADVTFHAPGLKSYRIAEAEGSRIGERIVRLVLEREASLAKDSGSSDISPDNYNFRFLREEAANGRRCHVLQLLPTRPKDKNLLRGTIWVDAHTYLICRTEGEPEKSPSWWVRNLRIVFVYADVAGMWLPTSSEFTAKVRVFGLSTMLVHDLKYNYSPFAGARENDPSEKHRHRRKAASARGGDG
jgi:Outer membrane lipoprotein-sorting protein